MSICEVLVLFFNICAVILSLIYGCKLLSVVFCVFIVLYCEYNLKFNLLSLCAGYCTSLTSKIRKYLGARCKHLNRHKTIGVFCSTPEMQRQNSSGIFRNDSVLSPIMKSDKSVEENGLYLNKSPRPFNTPLSRLSRYSLSQDVGYSHTSNSHMKIMSSSPQLRSRAGGVKTTQTVAGPLLASTRHKIDPHLYTDVNSPGLTTRIVQYNENNRYPKPTIDSRYKGVGQFPIINLNKTRSPPIPIKKSSVKIRIAPPDIPINVANNRMHMLNTEQHRPLLPSPIQESSGSPTKSVLEALKEISRKRIHTQDETEYIYTEDISKRQRKESLPKNAIGPTPFARPPISKRARDDDQREFLDASLFNRPSPPENGYKCWRPKKRQRNETMKCNDILSSLSSSRHLQRENSKRKSEMSPENEVKHVKLTMQNVSQISIPACDSVEEDEINDIFKTSDNNKDHDRLKTPLEKNPAEIRESKGPPKITLFNKAYPKIENNNKEPAFTNEDGCENMLFVKPRKKSVNKPVGTMSYTERCKLSQMLSCLGDKDKPDDFQIPPQPAMTDLLNDTTATSSVATSIINAITSPQIEPTTSTEKTSLNNTQLFTPVANSTSVATSVNSNITPVTEKKLEVVNTTTSSHISFNINQSPVTTVSSPTKSAPSEDISAKSTPPTLTFVNTTLIPKSTVETISSTGITSTGIETVPSSVVTNTTGGFSFPLTNGDILHTPIKASEPETKVPPTTPFTFGITKSVSTTTVTTTPNKPVFSFGTSTTTSSNIASTTGGFQFDLNKPNINESSKGENPSTFGIKPIMNIPASKPELSNVANSSSLFAGNVSLNNGPSKNDKSSTNTTLLFGASTTQNQNIFANPSNSLFGAASMKSSTTLFNQNSITTTTTLFNQNSTTTTAATSTTSTTAPLFSFNDNNNTVKSTASTFVFGNNSNTFTTPNLNNIAKIPVTPSKNTNAPPTSSVTSATFGSTNLNSGFNSNVLPTEDSANKSIINNNLPSIFGASSAAQSFSFGSSSGVTKSLFGAAASTITTSSITSFGSINTTTPSASTTVTPNFTSAISSFGAVATQPSIFGSTSTNTPIFGTTSTNNPIFGTTTTKTVFGSPITTASSSFIAPVTSTGFGSVSKPVPAFGQPTTSSFVASTIAPPSFGAATATSSFGAATATSSFGTLAANVPSFGVPKTDPPSFGVATATNSPFAASVGTVPAFGAPTTTSAGPFGLNTTTNFLAQPNPVASTFSTVLPNSTSNINAPNAFGGNSTGFGSASATAFGVKAPSTFSSSTTTGNLFGNNAPAPNAPAFGTTNTTTEKNVFTFGSNNTAPTASPFTFGAQQSVSNTFSFGANPTVPTFGSSAPQGTSFVTPGVGSGNGAFGSPSPAFGSPSPAGGMFSIGAGGSSSKTRIRGRRQR